MKPRRASRRRFLKEGATLAGLAAATPALAGQSLTGGGALAPALPAATVKDLMAYGERSRFVTTVRATMTMIGNMDMHRGVANWDARTPLAEMIGTITPASLHFISSHGNTPPDINPKDHRLIIHGMVERPLVFTLEELMRLPYVNRIHYIECINNRPARGRDTVDEGHGMIGCSEWTGVPLSLLFEEAGVKNGGSWIVAEGADETKHASSMAMGKALEDVIVAYGQNGEPVRPHQGYPLRLVVPGFEGKYNVKWLKGIKVVDRPYMSYWEQHHYMDSHRKTRYYVEQGPKSVITRPGGGQRLPSPGFYNITGLAWSGCGAVRKVEVSTDDGKTWSEAQIQGSALRMALTRFQLPWTWNGEETVLQSRCTDERGQIQPTAEEYATFWEESTALIPVNSIQPWRVTRTGEVLNAL